MVATAVTFRAERGRKWNAPISEPGHLCFSGARPDCALHGLQLAGRRVDWREVD